MLRLLAEEMWISKRGTLTTEMCESLAAIFCETESKTPMVSRQVRERLVSHALLATDSSQSGIRFDRDHFKEFFFGEQLGHYLSHSSKSDLRKLLRIETVSPWTLDSAVAHATRGGLGIKELLRTVLEVAASEGPSSFVRENSGALSLRLADRLLIEERPFEISSVTLPPEALYERPLQKYHFSDCYFRSTKFPQTLEDVLFEKCEFEHIDLIGAVVATHTRFSDCVFHGITVGTDGQTADYHDPDIIESCLSNLGMVFLRQ